MKQERLDLSRESGKVSQSLREVSQIWGQKAGTSAGDTPGTKGLRPFVPGRVARDKCPIEVSRPKSMREQMPMAAEVVDLLRGINGKAAADAQIKRAMAGQGGLWVVEIGPDGVERSFGSAGLVQRRMVGTRRAWGYAA